ncbi:MAG: hypothetical protein IJE10_00950 [Clostridia bacterium]|nr:hypothetical protein [Clostridia bacterium]
MKRFNIITGHYGSGKTEFALNLAFLSKQWYNRTVIADLDIVNPYFRTNDAVQTLKERGIDVVASSYASSNVDIPALPPEMASVFDVPDRFVVLDVGGDEDGAAVLGRFSPRIKNEDYEMMMVINALRPLSSTPEEIIELMGEIERTSRLKITGLVNNTNLSYQSTVEHLLEGQKVVEEVSKRTGLPILYIAGTKEILDALPENLNYPRLCLELNMHLPFMA